MNDPEGMKPPEGAIPLAPFFRAIFGDISSEDDISAAIAAVDNDPESFDRAFREYIDQYKNRDLRAPMGEGESGQTA